jgi:hypothetical protein
VVVLVVAVERFSRVFIVDGGNGDVNDDDFEEVYNQLNW